jgi:phosphoribosylformylglycinamidine synthase PurS subunit
MNVRVYVTPKEGILDPQGATVERALPALGFDGVSGVRIGKFIELRLRPDDGVSPEQARAQVDDMCRKLLANPIIEDFTFEIDDER